MGWLDVGLHRLRPVPWGWQYRAMGIVLNAGTHYVVDVRYSMRINEQESPKPFSSLERALAYIDGVTDRVHEALIAAARR